MIDQMLEERMVERFKEFLESLDCIRSTSQCGPVQSVNKESTEWKQGYKLMVPLPFAKASELSNQIKAEVLSWAEGQNLEIGGYIRSGDAPLLMLSVRKPKVSKKKEGGPNVNDK